MSKATNIQDTTPEMETNAPQQESQASFPQEEFDAAQKQAQSETSGLYTHHFAKPFAYGKKEYTSLTFDFEELTGADSLAVENELQRQGITVIVPTFSGEYLIRIAARACTEEIGCDAFKQMRIADYNKIRSKARSFLLNSEL